MRKPGWHPTIPDLKEEIRALKTELAVVREARDYLLRQQQESGLSEALAKECEAAITLWHACSGDSHLFVADMKLRAERFRKGEL